LQYLVFVLRFFSSSQKGFLISEALSLLHCSATRRPPGWLCHGFCSSQILLFKLLPSHGFLENGEKERNFAYNDKKEKKKDEKRYSFSTKHLKHNKKHNKHISIIRYSFGTKHLKHNKKVSL